MRLISPGITGRVKAEMSVVFLVVTVILILLSFAIACAEEAYDVDDCRDHGVIYYIEVDFSELYYPCPQWEDMKDKVEIMGNAKVYDEPMQFFIKEKICKEYPGEGFIISLIEARTCGGKVSVLEQAKR